MTADDPLREAQARARWEQEPGNGAFRYVDTSGTPRRPTPGPPVNDPWQQDGAA